jgi:hypothetical protein
MNGSNRTGSLTSYTIMEEDMSMKSEGPDSKDASGRRD